MGSSLPSHKESPPPTFWTTGRGTRYAPGEFFCVTQWLAHKAQCRPPAGVPQKLGSFENASTSSPDPHGGLSLNQCALHSLEALLQDQSIPGGTIDEHRTGVGHFNDAHIRARRFYRCPCQLSLRTDQRNAFELV